MTHTNQTEQQTPAQARLQALRAEAAALEPTTANARAILPEPALPVVPGEQFHAKLSGVTFATGGGFLAGGHVTKAGETYTVTQALIDASYSASGRSWLAIIGDDAAQLERWGEVRFGLGPAAPDAPTWNRRGDADWTEQRAAAKAAAWAEPNPDARAAALRAVDARFGPQVTTATYTKVNDPSIAAAEAQQAALNAGGVRYSQYVVAREAGDPEDRR